MDSVQPRVFSLRKSVRIGMGGLFILASIFHFTASETELKIIPPSLPLRRTALYLSGVFELLGGCGLLLPRFRSVASWGLAALLVAIAPANAYHAVLYFRHGKPSSMRFYHYLRMPMQLVLILLTLWAGRDEPPR